MKSRIFSAKTPTNLSNPIKTNHKREIDINKTLNSLEDLKKIEEYIKMKNIYS